MEWRIELERRFRVEFGVRFFHFLATHQKG